MFYKFRDFYACLNLHIKFFSTEYAKCNGVNPSGLHPDGLNPRFANEVKEHTLYAQRCLVRPDCDDSEVIIDDGPSDDEEMTVYQKPVHEDPLAEGIQDALIVARKRGRPSKGSSINSTQSAPPDITVADTFRQFMIEHHKKVADTMEARKRRRKISVLVTNFFLFLSFLLYYIIFLTLFCSFHFSISFA